MNLSDLNQPNILTHHYQRSKLNWFQGRKNTIIDLDQHFKTISFPKKHNFLKESSSKELCLQFQLTY